MSRDPFENLMEMYNEQTKYARLLEEVISVLGEQILRERKERTEPTENPK